MNAMTGSIISILCGSLPYDACGMAEVRLLILTMRGSQLASQLASQQAYFCCWAPVTVPKLPPGML